MKQRTKRTVTVLRAILYEIRAENITFIAGSIAYHAFVSLLPLLLLLLLVITTLGNRGLEESFLEITRAGLTPGANDVLVTELRRSSASAGISILGGLFLLWGTLRIFRGLDTVFSDIYESEAENTFSDQVFDGLLVFATVAVAVLLVIVIQSSVSTVATGNQGWLLQRFIMIIGLSLTFVPMYYVFPDQENMSVLEVIPGVLFAAIGVTVLESLFRVYIAISSQSPTQSVIAGILVLLTWLYLSGLVILVGAAVNAVISNRSQDVNIQPVIGGIELNEKGPLPKRDELIETLGELNKRVKENDGMIVRVSDHEVVLPPPDIVIMDRGESGVIFGSGPVGLEYRWSTQ